jgi:hypothetical protein
MFEPEIKLIETPGENLEETSGLANHAINNICLYPKTGTCWTNIAYF